MHTYTWLDSNTNINSIRCSLWENFELIYLEWTWHSLAKTKKNYSIHFGCIDLIHHMHNQYKNLLAYVKCSYKQDPMVTFSKSYWFNEKAKSFQHGDFDNLWIWQVGVFSKFKCTNFWRSFCIFLLSILYLKHFQTLKSYCFWLFSIDFYFWKESILDT